MCEPPMFRRETVPLPKKFQEILPLCPRLDQTCQPGLENVYESQLLHPVGDDIVFMRSVFGFEAGPCWAVRLASRRDLLDKGVT